MSSDSHVTNVLVRFGVDDPDLAIILARVSPAVADVEKLCVRIEDHTVRTQIQLDRIKQIQSITAENAEHSVVTAGHEHFVERFYVRDTLRLSESRDALHPLLRSQIHDFYRAILK